MTTTARPVTTTTTTPRRSDLYAHIRAHGSPRQVTTAAHALAYGRTATVAQIAANVAAHPYR